MNLNNVQSFDNGQGGAVVAYRWVELGAGGVSYTDSDTDVPVGSILHDRSATDVEPVDISLFNCGGVHWATAGAAIAQYAEVECAASGKVVTKDAGTARGVAISAATADGDVIRVLVY